MVSRPESGEARPPPSDRGQYVAGALPHSATRWLIFGILSANFFMVVASTYGSLGVALPYMIQEMKWSWTNAGSGFTILALMSGLGSVLPAVIIQRVGVKVNYLFGGVLMAGGFCLLAIADDLPRYFLGTFLAGLGFPLLANVPSVQVLTEWFPDRRSMAIGAFMMIGGLGGVAGPLLVTGIVESTGSWRLHWTLMAVVMLALGLLSALLVKPAPRAVSAAGENSEVATDEPDRSSRVFYTQHSWSWQDALKTRQFALITLALTMSMFCVLTGNTWAVAHMDTLGVATGLAAGSLSVAAAVNASSRLLGGLVASRIDPKWLLVAALAAEAAGMLALAVADNPVAIAIFALGEGFGFGMSLFATTLLLVNYFGSAHNARLLGILNLVTTIAMLGPVVAGVIADNFGSIAILLQAYAVLLVLLFIALLVTGPPQQGGKLEIQVGVSGHDSLETPVG